MEHFKFLICLAFFVVISGCDAKFEEINQRIDGLEDRIEYLEELCAQINTNIASLRTLVNAVQGNDYITSIVPIVAGEDTIGYTITFTKSGPVTIYNGKDGKDGMDGVDGDSMFESITQDDVNVYFRLKNGENITIPKEKQFDVVFEGETTIACNPGETVRVPYMIIGGNTETVIECVGKDGWKAEVEKTDLC